MNLPAKNGVEKEELITQIARVMHCAMGEQWHYSSYGDYAFYEDLPRFLKNILEAAAEAALDVMGKKFAEAESGDNEI